MSECLDLRLYEGNAHNSLVKSTSLVPSPSVSRAELTIDSLNRTLRLMDMSKFAVSDEEKRNKKKW